MMPLVLSAYTATSCIGTGLAPMLSALRGERSGLTHCPPAPFGLDTYIGEVPGLDENPLPAALAEFECRNNRLAHLGLKQDGFAQAVAEAAARLGRARIGVFLGTSTSGILETELAFGRRDPESGALPPGFPLSRARTTPSRWQHSRCGRSILQVPPWSSPRPAPPAARSSQVPQRAIAAGVIDAAVVGGADSLCGTTLYGFHSLQLVSQQPVRPFDVARDGISIGEAAAFALLERADATPTQRISSPARGGRVERCTPHVRPTP